MAIKMLPDLGAPLGVTAIDLLSETYAPNYNEWAAYIVAVAGYLGAWMGWGGDTMKNMGIAAFPWAAKKLYDRVKGGMTARPSRMTFRRSAGVATRAPMTRYPAVPTETQFGGVKLT